MIDYPVPVGTRVKVAIQDRSTFATGSAECLDGKTGTVERCDRVSVPVQNMILVAFDTPAKRWWKHQSPPTHQWFSPEDLERLS